MNVVFHGLLTHCQVRSSSVSEAPGDFYDLLHREREGGGRARERERERERERGRRVDRQAGRQADRQTHRHTHRGVSNVEREEILATIQNTSGLYVMESTVKYVIRKNSIRVRRD